MTLTDKHTVAASMPRTYLLTTYYIYVSHTAHNFIGAAGGNLFQPSLVQSSLVCLVY